MINNAMQVILEDSECDAMVVNDTCTVGVDVPESFKGFIMSVDSAGVCTAVLHPFTGKRATEFCSHTEDIHLLTYTRFSTMIACTSHAHCCMFHDCLHTIV